MEWDLGLEGLALLAAMSTGCGLVAALLVGGGAAHRWSWLAVTTAACFGVGLVISEMWFGWATEQDLQPNVDGLSVDEVLLAQVLTGVLLVVVARWRGRTRPG
jgi:hypothetical protein